MTVDVYKYDKFFNERVKIIELVICLHANKTWSFTEFRYASRQIFEILYNESNQSKANFIFQCKSSIKYTFLLRYYRTLQ